MKKLFFNGTIRTMTLPETVEAVLTDGEKIAAVGKYDELLPMAADAEKIDLNGSTMLPGFIDAHSHMSAYAMSFLQVPLDECSNFEEIAERIRSFITENTIKPGQWVMAKGYDHNALKEKTHPTRELLDSVSPDNPLVLQHISGHVGVFNSKALEKFGVTPDTKSPQGGKIDVKSGKLTGFMEETAFINYVKKVPMNNMDDILSACKKAQDCYAAYGITTIQEGMTVGQMLPLYKFLLEKKVFKLDLIAYISAGDGEQFFEEFPQAVNKYNGRFKIGGYKIVLDGSPQGRTAWMQTPYMNETPPYYGYGAMSDDEVVSAVHLAAEKGVQILAHCNGDAAAKQYIEAVSLVSESMPVSSLRPVMIHAQLLRKDQLNEVKRLGIMPSFFVAHVYHWGDVHIENFGKERASEISPAASALEKGIRFTFHQDTPVIAPDMLETIWCAVNRVTKNGVLLGGGERISVYEALKAVTVNAAYQYFEQDSKGSIEAGKKADLVVLDRDPMKTDPMEIKNIKVLKTFKEAEIIYDRDAQGAL